MEEISERLTNNWFMGIRSSEESSQLMRERASTSTDQRKNHKSNKQRSILSLSFMLQRIRPFFCPWFRAK